MANMQPRPTRIRKHIQNVLLLPLALLPAFTPPRRRLEGLILQPIRLPLGFNGGKWIARFGFRAVGCGGGQRSDVTSRAAGDGGEGCGAAEEEHGGYGWIYSHGF